MEWRQLGAAGWIADDLDAGLTATVWDRGDRWVWRVRTDLPVVDRRFRQRDGSAGTAEAAEAAATAMRAQARPAGAAARADARRRGGK